MKAYEVRAAKRRDWCMREARRVAAKFDEYMNAGLILTNERPVAYYAREARRLNRVSWQQARISRAWQGDRRAMDMPRIMYAYGKAVAEGQS